MAEYINHKVATDNYSDADALVVGPDFTCDHVTITVDSEDASLGAGGNACLFQLAQGTPGNWKWMDEREFYSEPQSFRVGNVIGARFRNAVAGKKAIIDATLCGPADPDFGSGTPRQFAITSAVTFLGAFTPSQWPPQSAADGDVATLYDDGSYSGLVFNWPLVYTAATDAWTPYKGIAAPAFYYPGDYASSGSFLLPVAGTYDFAEYGGAGHNASGLINPGIYLGTTAGGQEISGIGLAAANPAYGHATGLSYTGTKAQVIYATDTGGGGTSVGLVVLVSPSSLANS